MNAREKRQSAADEAAGRQQPDPAWVEAYSAVWRIAHDPDETPTRRRIASNAIASLSSAHDALHTYAPAATPRPRGQSGGDFLAADAQYDGWGRD